jgi:DNA end-binding protein Ku
MARAIWTGSLAFGLVNVPVGLFSATEDKTVHFNQFQAGTSDRIRYKRVNERTGREVELADIVRGHEVAGGDYVLVSDEELEAVEPGRSRTIDIDDFVDLAEIDPVYYNKTYYLGPQGDAAHAYALLHRAMSDTGKAGIATFVMHGKQHLVAIRPAGDVLALQTMFFSDEVRDPDQVIDGLPAGEKLPARELSVAKQLIGSMTSAWDASQYRDTYRDLVQDMIKRKRKGEEIVTEGAPEAESDVTDLMEALRRSAEEMRGRRPAQSGGRRRATARQGGKAKGRASGSRSSSKAKPAGGSGSAKSGTRASASARTAARRKAS